MLSGVRLLPLWPKGRRGDVVQLLPTAEHRTAAIAGDGIFPRAAELVSDEKVEGVDVGLLIDGREGVLRCAIPKDSVRRLRQHRQVEPDRVEPT